jgi:hypothetical protein
LTNSSNKKTLRELVYEHTGEDFLSPISIARDQRLRALYDAMWEARNTPEFEIKQMEFANFVMEEYLGKKPC